MRTLIFIGGVLLAVFIDNITVGIALFLAVIACIAVALHAAYEAKQQGGVR